MGHQRIQLTSTDLLFYLASLCNTLRSYSFIPAASCGGITKNKIFENNKKIKLCTISLLLA